MQDQAQSEPSDRSAGRFRELEGVDLPRKFEFIRMLGRGHIGSVYLARNKALKRLAAVKVLHKDLAADPIGRKRFLREAQAAARISHPCVISVYAVGALSNDVPYIEMEYIEGNNLAEMLRSHGRLDASAARKLLTQLSGALAAAHVKRIIHRDVNPENVLIEHDSKRVLLTDFGVAGILETGSETVTRLTREGECFGDPTYMSPEQLRGEALTEQTDIYSLGILGYEILTLQGPFGNSEITDLTRAHLRRPPLDLHAMNPQIPVDLSDALKRCLSKKPGHRPRSIDLAESFESFSPGNGFLDTISDTDDGPKSALVSFLNEAKKRRVYRASAAYVTITFVLLQVADLLLPPFDAPDWVFRLLIITALAGFPVAVILAWIFDFRKGHLVRTDAEPGSFSRKTSRAQQLVLQALGLILSIVIAVAVAWWLLAAAD